MLLGFLSRLLFRKSSTFLLTRGASKWKFAAVYFITWYLAPWLLYGLLCWAVKTSSFFNLRYLIVYLIAGSFLWFWIIESFHSARVKRAWIVLFLVFSFCSNVLPLYLRSGVFSAQPKEDWRGLIQYVNRMSGSEAPLVLVRSGLVEGDRVLQPALMTPTWNALISSPMADFYVNQPWDVLSLPYHWIMGITENYLDNEVRRRASSRKEFWLVVRGDKETQVFIKSFLRYMSARTKEGFVQDMARDDFGISLLHFRRATQSSW